MKPNWDDVQANKHRELRHVKSSAATWMKLALVFMVLLILFGPEVLRWFQQHRTAETNVMVKRYDFDYDGTDTLIVCERPGGDYVMASDYDALAAERDALQKEMLRQAHAADALRSRLDEADALLLDMRQHQGRIQPYVKRIDAFLTPADQPTVLNLCSAHQVTDPNCPLCNWIVPADQPTGEWNPADHGTGPLSGDY